MEHHDKCSQIVDVNFYDKQENSNLGKAIEAKGEFLEPISREQFLRTATLDSIGADDQTQNKLLKMSFRRFDGDSWKEYLANMIFEHQRLKTSQDKAIVKNVNQFGNERYFDAMTDYISKVKCIIPISVCVTGFGNTTLRQVLVELHWNNADNIEIYNIDTIPRKPEKSFVSNLQHGYNNKSQTIIDPLRDKTVVRFHFDAINPGQTVAAAEEIFVCSTTSTVASIEVKVYSENNQPAILPMKMSFNIGKKMMDLLELGTFED
jgi:hypothetical protein